MVQEADYVIVGAGSAGCVLANRLSADPSTKVVVLEAGGDDRPLRELGQWRSNLNIHIPAGFTRMMADPKINWNYISEPDALGRKHAIPRGKVLGGSSSINGMLWVRGLPLDYDGWRQLGCEGWSWADVEPIFRRVERKQGDVAAGPSALMDISRFRVSHPTLDRMLKAFREAGAPETDDINSERREGVTLVTTNTLNGRRRSAAVTYLHPAMSRPNLRVLKRALASRVLFEGKRAVGVEFVQGGAVKTVRARREVILSGGAINSPQLLELSGIGDGERLRSLGIEVLAHSPKVGENLMDHVSCMTRARLKPGSPSYNSWARGVPLLIQIAAYGLTRRGLLSQGGASLTGYIKSNSALDVPDLQYFGSPGTIDYEAAKRGRIEMDREPGLTIGGYVMRPKSRGWVHAASPDFRQPPKIATNFLDDEDDRRRSVELLKISRNVLRQPALAGLVDHELAPGQDALSDADLLAYAKASGSTSYHQSGSCAMGAGADAVVDPQLRVNGVTGLRVVDASVMPTISSGNTHAPTVMIAEKASDLIRQSA